MSIVTDQELKALKEKKTPPAKEIPESSEEETGNTEAELSEAKEVLAETSDESDTSQNEEVESEESNPEEGKQKPKLPKGVRRRIDKLSKRNAEKDQRIAYLESELARKNSELPKADAEAEKPKALASKPKVDDFKTHEEYLDARDEWNRRAWKAEEQEREIKTKGQRQIESYQSRAREFAKGHPDWKDVIEEVKDVQPPMALYHELLDSENGPELYYELAKRPTEYKRICALGPLAAARALGKFESSLKDSPEPQKKITKAPKPLTPVGTKSVGEKDIYDPSISFKEFERLENERLKQKRIKRE